MSLLRLQGDVDSVGRTAVEGLIASQVCAAVDYHAEVPSTNSWALDDLRSGVLPEGDLPKLYLADCQRAGRGRHGRIWVSDSGTLTFSLVVPLATASLRWSGLLPLATGLGVARWVEFEFAPLRARLKWPNDVYIDAGKLAGILLETSQAAPDRVVIGVGINIVGTPASESSARSLAAVTGRSIHRYDALPSVVRCILETINELADAEQDVVSQFRDHCLLTGQVVRFRDQVVDREGLCQGITDDGALSVLTDDGEIRVRSGEAQLVRLQN